MKFKYPILLTTCIALALSACSRSNNHDIKNDVKERQNLMQDWRGANESMKGMIERPESFDVATFKERANFIAQSSEQMWQYFSGEDKKGGKSTDAVWSDYDAFLLQVENFNVAAKNLADVATTATQVSDVEQAFGQMAESCGSCHKAFKAQ